MNFPSTEILTVVCSIVVVKGEELVDTRGRGAGKTQERGIRRHQGEGGREDTTERNQETLGVGG